MLKNKFEIAKEIVDQYNKQFLNGDTFLHIQEWIEEEAKKEAKKTRISIDEKGNVIDINKNNYSICDSCGCKVKYHKVIFSGTLLGTLKKVIKYVAEKQKATNQMVYIDYVNISDLGLSHTEYGNLNRLANFGLLYRKQENGYKVKQGIYGVPQKRIADFLKGEWQVAKFYVVKSTTHERILSQERVFIDGILNKSDIQAHNEYRKNILPYYVTYLRLNDVL